MKVLFAVNNENISTQIVKKYQKDYKEIISYKNMYYFNAIIKELERDKSYDRIVISEDLEPFANNNYDEIEKFLFEKLDNISDEATGVNGKDIPIILLATDKRTKSDTMLTKLFGIGIYDVLIGQDRNTNNVCALLNKPRSKKEAKIYYKIDAEEVNYKSESEDNVSETEIKNILNHYRKLGKDEDRYIESFNNIAAQYNDTQLRIITKFLPLNVKAVLEERSAKYQSVMTFDNTTSTKDLMKKKNEEEGLKVGFLNQTNTRKPLEPVIVPKAVKKVATKKAINTSNIAEQKVEVKNNKVEAETLLDFDDIEEPKTETVLPSFEDILEETKNSEDTIENTENIKRGRGRPRKVVSQEEISKANVVKRGRGRPRKITEPLQNLGQFEESDILPGFDEPVEDKEENTLPGFDNLDEANEGSTLPGFDDLDEENEENALPGFDDLDEENEGSTLPGFDDLDEDKEENTLPSYEQQNVTKNNYHFDSSVLSKDKKIVSFVGTTKNGTSFLVNNLAKCLSSMGIKTAILDLTSNKNSYYIYTKNEEKLRNTAYESMGKLINGIAEGIQVDKYLDVYTSLPGENNLLENSSEILATLVENYSIILMDCDFNTPEEYFEIAQEIYIVQTMDILTIQPMTAFLRDLKAKDILQTEKVRVVVNKEMKVKGLTPKAIVGGLAFYNDPAMSFMTELFNKDIVKYYTIPFDIDACSKYLEGVMNCEITINNYSKTFNGKLKELANIVYPLIDKKNQYNSGYMSGNRFSSNMNNTLEQMRNKY